MAEIIKFNKENVRGIAKENHIFSFAKDLNEGKTNNEDGFKKAIATTCGIDLSKYKNGNVRLQELDPVQRHNFFNLIGVTIDSIVGRNLESQLDPMVDEQSVDWGEKIMFDVDCPYLPTVTKLAKGTTVMTSDMLHTDVIDLDTEARGVAIKESGFNILSGRVNWSNRVNTVQKAMTTQIKTDINTALVGTLSALGASFKADGSAFNSQTFLKILQHVKAGSNTDSVTTFGTLLGLSQIIQPTNTSLISEKMKEEYNNRGFVANFMGATDLMELVQAHIPNTDNFALDDNFIYIMPSSDQRIVKLGFEGEGIIQEFNTPQDSEDMSTSYKFIKYYGIRVVPAGKFGIYKLS